MKVSKIFGFVLFFHLGVIALLIVQPGCQTTQPPTETHVQNRALSTRATKAPGDLIEATRVDSLDAAFNAGFESSPGDFSEFDPIEPLPSGPTVEVSGSSYQTYTVQKGDSLWAIARRHNVSVNELYSANGLNKNSVLQIGQQIRIPVDGGTASVSTVTPDTYQPTGYNTSGETYTVKRGDTLSGIARRFDTTVGAIKAANGKTSDMIRIGEDLVIPVASGAAPAPSAPAPAPAPVTSGGIHIVQPGEYPATIARRYGMTTSELLAINGITDPRALQVGQRLRVDGSGSAANIATTTETVEAPVAAPAPAPAPAAPSEAPVEIRVVEADPLVEGETIDTDEMFESAVEIPVIRMDEE